MPKDIYTLIEERQSDRKYDPDYVIDKETLQRIAEAGRLSPSACNAQPWHFVIVTDTERKKCIAKALASPLVGNMNGFAKDASAFIVIVQEKVNLTSKLGTWIKGTSFPQYDIGIAAGFITLAAEHEGLGSCIMGWLDKDKVRSLLNIPKNKEIPLVIALGKSLSKQRKKIRKSSQEVISWEEYK